MKAVAAVTGELLQKPETSYPCLWPYRVIGIDTACMSQEIQAILSTYRFTLSGGNVSTKGTYASVHVEVQVADEHERNHVYLLLKKITGVIMVF